MNANSSAGSAGASNDANSKTNGFWARLGIRDFLGLSVFLVSALSIVWLAYLVMFPGDIQESVANAVSSAVKGTTDADAAAAAAGSAANSAVEASVESRERVFSTLVPLFGTWVGTVLAFYFSREGFQAAQKSLETVVEKLTPDQKLSRTTVAEAMTPATKTVSLSLSSGDDDSGVLLKTVIDVVNRSFTRVPILNSDGSGRYVVHRSTLFQYIYGVLDPTGEKKTPDGGPELKDLTLADLVADKEAGPKIKAVAWVPRSASLADAKAKMDQVVGCQDVFVTETGQASEPLVGWLTNASIQRFATV